MVHIINLYGQFPRSLIICISILASVSLTDRKCIDTCFVEGDLSETCSAFPGYRSLSLCQLYAFILFIRFQGKGKFFVRCHPVSCDIFLCLRRVFSRDRAVAVLKGYSLGVSHGVSALLVYNLIDRKHTLHVFHFYLNIPDTSVIAVSGCTSGLLCNFKGVVTGFFKGNRVKCRITAALDLDLCIIRKDCLHRIFSPLLQQELKCLVSSKRHIAFHSLFDRYYQFF